MIQTSPHLNGMTIISIAFSWTCHPNMKDPNPHRMRALKKLVGPFGLLHSINKHGWKHRKQGSGLSQNTPITAFGLWETKYKLISLSQGQELLSHIIKINYVIKVAFKFCQYFIVLNICWKFRKDWSKGVKVGARTSNLLSNFCK